MGSVHTERLESLLQSRRNVNEPEFKLALSQLATAVKDRFDHGSASSFDFFAAALRALSKLKGDAHSEMRLSAVFDCATYFFHGGHASETLEAARQIRDLALRTKSKLWIRKAHTLSGLVHADIGNIPEAIVEYARSLSIAKEILDVEGEMFDLINAGVALNYGGLYGEAMPCFRKAADLAEHTPSLKKYRPATFTNLAQSFFYLEDFASGFEAINHALDGAPEPRDSIEALNRTIREFTYVQLAIEVGQLETAREHSRLCQTYARRSETIRSRVLSDIASGLCEIHCEDASHGIAILETALDLSADVWACRKDALIALVKSYDAIGQPNRALDYLTQLLAGVRAVRERSIFTLLSLESGRDISNMKGIGLQDLRPMEYRAATLRAKVAECELVSSRIEMLERLAVAADLKEDSSGEHGYRVGRLSALLAERLGWSRDACNAIEQAARLHDIGKIGIPDRILLTSQELKDAERHLMSAHTLIGAELLAKSDVPQLRMAEEIARFHHEWWDGSGYPKKLAGSRIPKHARIVALADVFDALTHGRSFAEPWPVQRAVDEITGRRGTQFDPELTDHFLALVERLRVDHPNLDEYLGRAGRHSPFLQARRKIRALLTEEEAYVTPRGPSEGAVLQ